MHQITFRDEHVTHKIAFKHEHVIYKKALKHENVIHILTFNMSMSRMQ